MHLSLLKRLLKQDEPHTGPDPDITSVTEDSRRARPGALFVAVHGEQADGHAYAARAVAAGATVIVGDRPGLSELEGVPYWYHRRPRQASGIVAHALAGDPSKALTVIGVTGTNGKTSSVLLLRHLLEACGHPAAAFGTIGYFIGEEKLDSPHTTPFGEDLATLFATARDKGMTHVAMEASSHALEQDRVAGISFDVGVLTNVTQDHLDYHGTMEAYRRAKLRLFEGIEGVGRFTVVNRDDPSADWFIDASRVPCHTYGAGGDICAEQVLMDSAHTRFMVETPWGRSAVEMRLLGLHNVSNVLGVIAVAGGLGLSLDTIVSALADMPCVPGRFEHVDEGQPFQVIVDYAHTEDGLRNVLQAARAICRGRVLTLFGCGGDRDRGKRPKMARAAATLSDYCVLTSDNPRTEDPRLILNDAEAGLREAGRTTPDDYVVIEDRAEAMGQVLRMASPGDLVMIAGKGHEDYQILGTQRIHFDDRETARAILRSMTY